RLLLRTVLADCVALPSLSIVVDGRLDDPVWRNAPVCIREAAPKQPAAEGLNSSTSAACNLRSFTIQKLPDLSPPPKISAAAPSSLTPSASGFILGGRGSTFMRTRLVYSVTLVLVVCVSIGIVAGQDTKFRPEGQQIPAPGCLVMSGAWQGGSTPCAANEHDAWLADIRHWRMERKVRTGYDGSRYQMPELKWT